MKIKFQKNFTFFFFNKNELHVSSRYFSQIRHTQRIYCFFLWQDNASSNNFQPLLFFRIKIPSHKCKATTEQIWPQILPAVGLGVRGVVVFLFLLLPFYFFPFSFKTQNGRPVLAIAVICFNTRYSWQNKKVAYVHFWYPITHFIFIRNGAKGNTPEQNYDSSIFLHCEKWQRSW